MKKLLLYYLLLPLFCSSQNKPCNVHDYTPKWNQLQDFHVRYGPHEKMKVTNFYPAKMKPHLQTALSWIKNKAIGITGAKEANHYNIFYPGFPDPEQLYGNTWYLATGRLSYYYLRTVSRGLLCKDNRLSIYDSPADIYIYFNYLNEVARTLTKNDAKSISIPIRIHGKPVFEVPDIKRSEGRVDYYEYPGPPFGPVAWHSKWFFINGYVIRNSDKPLLIHFTRKEYLEQYLVEMESFYKLIRKNILEKTVVYSPEEIDKELKERIAEIKKFTEQGTWGYSRENMEQRIKKAEEFYQNKKEEEANKIKNLTKDADENYTASVQMIKDYLQKKPAAELNNPVAYRFGYKLVNALYEVSYTRRMLEELEAKPETRAWGDNKLLAWYNKDYFNNALPPDVPQFIAVEFVNLDGLHKNLDAIVANINRDYDFSALKALFPNNKIAAPIVQQASTAKKGKATFLPKLQQLPVLSFALPPVKNQQGTNVFTNLQEPGFNISSAQINFPARSSQLYNLPGLPTEPHYIDFIKKLHQSISSSIPAKEKTALDEYCVKNKITTSEQLARHGLGAWFSNKPLATLYLHSKAVVSNSSDGLSANNFAAFLIKSGYPEKAIPILQYWLRKYPKNELLLNNSACAYYNLGDADKAMDYARQCVVSDSLHPTANKILAFGHFKKGEKTQSIAALKRSLKSSYDTETISLLLKLDPKAKVSRLLYEGRAAKFEPRLIKRFYLPEPISSNETAEVQLENIMQVKESLSMTIDKIRAKRQPVDLEAYSVQLLKNMQKSQGIPPMTIQGQAIVFESMNIYNKDFNENHQYLKERLGAAHRTYANHAGAITKKYNDKMSKIEGGEGGDEQELMRLSLARCKELNTVLNDYLVTSASYINQHAIRLEYISRKHYSTYAHWAPYWLQSDEAADFPGTQIDYLLSMKSVLDMYPLLQPTDCSIFEAPNKDSTPGELMVWEEKFCPVKLSVGMGPVKMGVNCNTFSIGGGEVLVGDVEVTLNEDWNKFKEVTLSGGAGATWNLGVSNIAEVKAGVTGKFFIKSVKNDATGKWELNDVGTKSEATVSGSVASVEVEVKAIEVTLGVNSGISAEGVIPKIMGLK